jgi:hypothetical protein
MAEMEQWDKEIDKLSQERKQQLINAINTLKGWDFFHAEYKWTGYHIIGMTVQYRMEAEQRRLDKELAESCDDLMAGDGCHGK